MRSWLCFEKFDYNVIGKQNKYIDTIFTFDIETTSIYILDGKIYPAIAYKDLSNKQKEACKPYGFMYIWQLGINDMVYFRENLGRAKRFFKNIRRIYRL